MLIVLYLRVYKRDLKKRIEYYWVLHNGISYMSTYSDLANHFDSAESKQMRDRILGSLKFQY